MTPESIHKHLRRQPFEPFRVFLSDGSVYEVRHPEMMFVMQCEVVIALPRTGEQFARDAVYCDPLHITRIEPIDGNGANPPPKKRRS